MIIVNKNKVANVNLAGRGGKERQIREIFTTNNIGCTRINESLYDIVQGGHRIELKKQADTQWFDIGKYHNIDDTDKDIDMVFILTSRGRKNDMCKAGFVEKIFSIKLGKLLDILISNKTYNKWGWTLDNIKTCHEQKIKYPTQQAKVKIEVRKFFTENKNKFNILWER